MKFPTLRFGLLVGAFLVATAAAQVAPRSVSTIVSGGAVLTVDAKRNLYNPGAIAIDGTTIVGIGSVADIAARFRAKEQIDATNTIVMPGLINAHAHAPMVLYRGLADDLRLQEWLEKYIFPAEAKTVTRDMVRAGTRLAALEMIQSGTTVYADMYYFEEEIARTTRSAGMRGVLGQTIIQFPVPDAKTPEQALARTEAFLKEFARDDLIVPAVAPHSPYTLDSKTLLQARALATKYGAPVLIHVAETESELGTSKKDHSGMTPVGYLQSIGFFGPRTVINHGVWVDAADMKILRGHGVAVSHNPESNMKLASGIAPVPQYLAAGITVGLGTDGAASNNNLDMFEAMRFAALLHKVKTSDPRSVPATTALEMATINGARALGLEKLIGSLETGKRADIVIVATDKARLTPLYDPVSHVVYAAHGDDVRTVMVNGRVLMRDRKMLTLDEAAVLAEARKLAGAVRAAVGKTN
jgi:5-methylthioadenosine/S-adenosylhomocysteine deaminase